MSTRASFLNRPYGGYLHNEIPKEDDELTHVGPGTPCGEYLRRFWQPVTTSAELGDLPHRIRIMGEDLVVFRDGSGQVGLLELHCSHRGTSLEFGQICQKGIRCCYHGWLYDVDGKVMETPGEPADSTLKDRLYHGAYPTLEYKGLVFAYMGPPDRKPEFPIYDTISDELDKPGYRLAAGYKRIWPCNWMQIKDNSMDPAHLQFLHTIVPGVGFSSDFGENAELDFMESPAGVMYISVRRVGDRVWVRTADYVRPNIHQFPPQEDVIDKRSVSRPWRTIWAVPIDDTTTMQIDFWHLREGEERPKGPRFGQSADRSYEERQQGPGDYDAQVGQRSITVHSLEHLATTDRGVIMLRNVVRRGIQAVQEGRDPEGTIVKRGEIIPTYSTDTVVNVPEAPSKEADRQLLRDTGRKVAEESLKNPDIFATH